MIISEMLAEFYGCADALEHEAALTDAARAAVLAEGATILGTADVRYVPHGLTIGLFLAESHIVLTTWPEYRLLLVNVMLCNPAMDGRRVLDQLQKAVCPNGVRVFHEVKRAIGAGPEPWPAAVSRRHSPMSVTRPEPP